jgi:hypothetical protein
MANLTITDDESVLSDSINHDGNQDVYKKCFTLRDYYKQCLSFYHKGELCLEGNLYCYFPRSPNSKNAQTMFGGFWRFLFFVK